MLPPTSFLPPLKQVQNVSADVLREQVGRLREIFTPAVRGSGLAKPADEDNENDLLCADEFERSFSVQWLTTLVACSEIWEDQGLSDQYDHVLQEASRLLALFAGPSSTSSFMRRFVFSFGPLRAPGPPSLISQPLEVVLQDISIDSQDFSSVGNQTWGSACVLAELVAKSPADYLSAAFHRQAINVLELGAGTGLVSLAVAKFLSLHPSVDANVFATDFHPSVLNNLELNVGLNFPLESKSLISVQSLDWSMCGQVGVRDDWVQHFDLILGADIIYEVDHAKWIKICVQRCLMKPGGEALPDQPAFHLIIPLRQTHEAESQTIEKEFGAVKWAMYAPSGGTWAVGILHVQTVSRPALGNGREDVTYKYYRIGWGAA
jgi:predicted nicotinamide N-methyase